MAAKANIEITQEQWDEIERQEIEETERAAGNLSEALDRLSYLGFRQTTGSSASARRILRFAIYGEKRHTISLEDLLRLDHNNREAALLLIKTAVWVGPLSNFG